MAQDKDRAVAITLMAINVQLVVIEAGIRGIAEFDYEHRFAEHECFAG